MERNQLIATATSIYSFSEETAKEFTRKRELLVNQINSKMLSRSDIEMMVGDKNLALMQDNHANHARFMESMLKSYDPEVMVDTILWVFRSYRSRGFHATYWAAQLNAWCEVFKENLSPDSGEKILCIYSWMIVNIPTFTSLSDLALSNLESDPPH